MANEWKEIELGEVAEVVGGATPDTRVPEYYGGDVPWITPKDLSGYGFRRISRGERMLTSRGLKSCGTRLMPTGAVLLTSRAPIGYVAIAESPVCTNQGFKSLVLKPDHDPEFYYYLLKHNTETLERHATGSTFKEISTAIVKSLKFRVPAYAEQKRIAGILGALDDKIELNRRMNETLEQMARALFKSWFVDFEPVHAKAAGRQPFGMDKATADLFPDGFEDSKNRKIPQGWRAGSIGEIATNPRRGMQPGEIAPGTPYIGLEHMPRRSIALGEWEDSSVIESGKSAFKKGEILFGKLRPYFHKVGIAPVDGVCSTDILVLAPVSEIWFGPLLSYASSDELIQFTNLASTGTKMPRTNWDDVSSFEIIIPTHELAAVYTGLISKLTAEIEQNLYQTKTLCLTRDTLLPRLMGSR